MDDKISRVVILGGGTAGWMTASYLAKALGQTVSITVLEAPTIPKIGVGEATVPNLQRAFFDFLGLPEEEWMPECNGSYKMSVKFINWRTPGEGQATSRMIDGRPDHFYHPFGHIPDQDQVPLSHYWSYKRLRGTTDEPFDYACFWEPVAMDQRKAPRWLNGEPATQYAWHFDAHLVADFLSRFATNKQHVAHVQDEMVEVLKDSRGFITGLRTTTHGVIEGDLFVDCSGFRGLLINQAMAEPFVDMSDQLLCDRAVATAVPHDDDANGVEPYTSAIAMPGGWTWKIPLLGRFGTGYVYSSQFTDQDKATEDFCRLWGLDPDNTPLNQVRFRVGRNRNAWVNNCVGIGLSSCFLEPLESTGIYFITAAIYQLVKHFPDKSFDPVLIRRFNAEIETMFDDCKDFIQAHFHLSPREDTPFWKANKDLHVAEQMREKLAMYKAGLPFAIPVSDVDSYYGNLEEEFRNFWPISSYYCIFAGLGVLPDKPLPRLRHMPDSVARAEEHFADVRDKQRDLVASLPSTVEYLRQIHHKGYGRDG